MITKIFQEFQQKRAEIEMSVEEMKKDLKPYWGHVYLYGAGSSGIAFLYDLKKISVPVEGFLDANPKKQGCCLEELPILAMDALEEAEREKALVIVCINTDGKRYCKSFAESLRIGGHHGVYERLRGFGYRNIVDYTFFRHCFSLFQEEQYNAPSCSDVDLMLENQERICQVYEWLEDEESKDIFEKILTFRLLDDRLEIPTLSQDRQYFEEEFWRADPEAVFVDCGAFQGNSFRTFQKLSENAFHRYYGIEPDDANWEVLEKMYEEESQENQARMLLYHKAVWKDSEGWKLYELEGPGSFLTENKNGSWKETITIDEMLAGEKVTFLKMNIEGSEKEALEGARASIRRWKPTLAIAGYHRTDDFWKIPEMIKENRADYKLYLRSYMNHISFVYYAV